MPKVSVYVPDDLWDKVRDSAPEGNVSQLVQQALRALVAREPKAAYSQDPPRRAAVAASEVRQRLIEEARKEWAKGYTAGIEWSVKHGTWQRLQLFAREGFSLDKWIKWMSSTWKQDGTQMQSPNDMDDFQVAVANALGSKADPWGIIEWDSSQTFCAGFAKALTDLYRSVEAGEPILLPAAAGSTDGQKGGDAD